MCVCAALTMPLVTSMLVVTEHVDHVQLTMRVVYL